MCDTRSINAFNWDLILDRFAAKNNREKIN